MICNTFHNKKYHLAKILCLVLACLFLEGAMFGHHITSEIKIELSEKEVGDKAEQHEKEIEKETKKDKFYSNQIPISLITNAHLNLNAFWIHSNMAFCEIISPPPESVFS